MRVGIEPQYVPVNTLGTGMPPAPRLPPPTLRRESGNGNRITACSLQMYSDAAAPAAERTAQYRSRQQNIAQHGIHQSGISQYSLSDHSQSTRRNRDYALHIA